MPTDDWSHPEIVRALIRIETKLDAYRTEAVPRELYELREGQVDVRLHELGTRIADVEADQERHRREHADGSAANWRAWVVPIVVAVIVSVLAVIGSTVSRGITG